MPFQRCVCKDQSNCLISDTSYLIGSKLHSGFSFDQSCIYLHNDRLYRIGTAPALLQKKKKHHYLTCGQVCHLHGNKVSLTYLFSEEFHAQGPSAEYIAAEKAATRDEEPPSRSVLQFISHRLHLSHLSHHFLMGPEVQAT